LTIAGLQAVLQIAFGWGGEHLHRFLIHGVEYGIGYAGDDPHRVHVAELSLRPTERFVNDYDFTDGWRLDLPLEQILPAGAGRVYPRCTGGRRPARPRAAAGCGPSWSRPSPVRSWQRPSVRPRSTRVRVADRRGRVVGVLHRAR